MAPYVALLFASALVSAFSQILLKKSALRPHENLMREYLNAFVVCAYSIYFAAVFMDLYALKKVPVSYVPIVEASNYVFVLVLSRIFLREKLTKRRGVAVVVILSGIALYLFG